MHLINKWVHAWTRQVLNQLNNSSDLFCLLVLFSLHVKSSCSIVFFKICIALFVPVNWSKRVEVLHHDAVKVLEAVQFPKIVQVGNPILPQSRNLTERPDDAAALCVHLSDHRHTAAVAHTCSCERFYPRQGKCDRAAPHTPPGHPNNKKAHSALPSAATLAHPGTSGAKQGGWSK